MEMNFEDIDDASALQQQGMGAGGGVNPPTFSAQAIIGGPSR